MKTFLADILTSATQLWFQEKAFAANLLTDPLPALLHPGSERGIQDTEVLLFKFLCNTKYSAE